MYLITPLKANTPYLCRAHRQGPHRIRALTVVAFLLLFGGLATAQTPMPTLTLNAALDAAQARSATLPAQDAASRAARERAISAGRLPDPVLRLSVDNLPIEGPMRYSLTDDFMTQRSVEWMQTYTATSKREALWT